MIRVRIVMFILVLAATVGIGRWLPPDLTKTAFHASGYYFIFGSVVLWALLVMKRLSTVQLADKKPYWGAFALSLALTAIIFAAAPPKFKVLADETNLIGVSMSMHWQKTTGLPLEGFLFDGSPDKTTMVADKRPLLYPLLVSFVHGVSGYRAENGFVVNFVCGVLILFTVYLWLSRFVPHKWALLGIFFTAALPGFGLWITSGGFEAVNLLFLLLVLLIMKLLADQRRIDDAELLLITTALLCQCRYESAIVGLVVILLSPLWITRKLIQQATVVTLISPALMIPLLWQRQLFLDASEPVKFGIELMQTTDAYFSLAYFWPNASKNLFVVMGLNPAFGFSWPIFALAIAGIYYLCRGLLRKHPDIIENKLFLAFSASVGLGLTGVISAYFWGDLTSPVSNRFGLAFIPFLVFPAVLLLSRLDAASFTVHQKLIITVGGFLFLWHIPVVQQGALIQSVSLPYEYDKTLSVLKSHYDPRKQKILIIAEQPNLYLVQGYSAITYHKANREPLLVAALQDTYFDKTLVIQRCDGETGQPLTGNTLTPHYGPLTAVATVKVRPELRVILFDASGRTKLP